MYSPLCRMKEVRSRLVLSRDIETSVATLRIDQGWQLSRSASKYVDLNKAHFLESPSWLMLILGASEILPMDSGLVIWT